jgi:hypothetical protein
MEFALYDQIYTRFDVNEETECWEWNATRTNDGYPVITFEGKTVLIHRTMFELRWGPIPPDQQVHHECFNTCCICPAHLRSVTAQEIMLCDWLLSPYELTD